MNNTTETKVLINQTELLQLCNAVDKSTFVHILYETKVDMNKKGNPYYGTTKVVSGNFLIGNWYQSRVVTNGEKEGIEADFKAEKPNGKTHISKCVLVSDSDANVYYLMYEYFDGTNVKVLDYKYNGDSIAKNLFEAYIKKASTTSSRQPQERKVNVKTLKLSNIKELSLNGTKYIIED